MTESRWMMFFLPSKDEESYEEAHLRFAVKTVDRRTLTRGRTLPHDNTAQTS